MSLIRFRGLEEDHANKRRVMYWGKGQREGSKGRQDGVANFEFSLTLGTNPYWELHLEMSSVMSSLQTQGCPFRN